MKIHYNYKFKVNIDRICSMHYICNSCSNSKVAIDYIKLYMQLKLWRDYNIHCFNDCFFSKNTNIIATNANHEFLYTLSIECHLNFQYELAHLFINLQNIHIWGKINSKDLFNFIEKLPILKNLTIGIAMQIQSIKSQTLEKLKLRNKNIIIKKAYLPNLQKLKILMICDIRKCWLVIPCKKLIIISRKNLKLSLNKLENNKLENIAIINYRFNKKTNFHIQNLESVLHCQKIKLNDCNLNDKVAIKIANYLSTNIFS